jgi:hypothetical protein
MVSGSLFTLAMLDVEYAQEPDCLRSSIGECRNGRTSGCSLHLFAGGALACVLCERSLKEALKYQQFLNESRGSARQAAEWRLFGTTRRLRRAFPEAVRMLLVDQAEI